MSNEIAVIEQAANMQALEVFSTEAGVESLIEKIEAEVNSIVPDTSTAKGRKDIASVAFKVSKTKTALDGLGKDLVAGWKEKAKAVDAERKQVRDRLDALRDSVRAPLTEWEEAEKQRIADEAAEAAEVERKKEVDAAHELAILMYEKHLADVAAEAKRIEDERIAKEKADTEAAEQAEREAAARRQKDIDDAKEQARLDAEAKAAKDAADAEARIEAERKASAEREAQLERDKIAAEERRKIEIEQAAEREKQLAIKAKQDADAAVQAEKDRVAAEKQAEAEATAKREADKAHYKKIMGEAKAGMMRFGISDADAVNILKAIKSGDISHVSIQF